MPQAEQNIVLGTAGHIDHGKSALVQALTGTDPDRLAEEKERGITIELGFAQLVLPDGSSMGVVDVPGHERFVRQMISGSTGIDIALLCIAADDGIMPQTREHMAVIELLAIPTLVVALTKCDRVDAEWVEMVSEEVRAFLEAGSYAGAPIVATSARTGEGLDELRHALLEAARATVSAHRAVIVRMPVDRVFTIKGAGTVITGTLWSGSVRLDDELEVLPGGRTARVRSIQMHGRAAECAPAGNRVALNLSDLKTSEIRPGDFLATPGAIEATDRFDCSFSYASPLVEGKPLRSGTRVRIAHGTREAFGRLLFMNGQDELKPHETCYAQIRLEEELPLSWQDRFIVRSYSPVRVIGGGIVLASHPRRRTTLPPQEQELLDALRAGDAQTACGIALGLQTAPTRAPALAEQLGAPASEVERWLDELVAARKAVVLVENGWKLYASPQAMQKALGALENALLKFHAANADELGVKKNDLLLRSGLHMDATAFDALLARAAADGKLVVEEGVISHPKAGAGAKQLEAQNAKKVAAALAEAGCAPPTTDELAKRLGMSTSTLARALGTLEKDGAVVRVDKSLSFDAAALGSLRDAVASHLAAHGSGTAAELKDAMGTSRKYAIPLLEHFDRIGLTIRDGDARKLRQT